MPKLSLSPDLMREVIRDSKSKVADASGSPRYSGRMSRSMCSVLASHRKRAGYSQRYLAQRIGLNDKAIEQMELGYRGYSVDSLALLWRELGDPWLEDTLNQVLSELDSGERKPVVRNPYGVTGKYKGLKL